MNSFLRASAIAVALVVTCVSAAPASDQSSAKKRTPPPKSEATSQTRKPPAPPAQAVPRPKAPEPTPPRAPRTPPRTPPHASPPHDTYLYPFVPFADFDFVYRFPYGVYPYSRYGYPYSPYRFVFPPPGCVTTEIETHGSVRLDLPQRDAAVFVDGFYVGVVDDFNGLTEHLNLTPGPHHLELRAPGFVPLTFDVNVEAGRIITYRTPMQPAESPATSQP